MKMNHFCYRIAFVFILFVLTARMLAAQPNSTILIEAESFDNYGGWSDDTQFMDIMGSPYLIAHGIGKPVADAVTTVECAENGTYQVWVRTYDWVAPWRGEEWNERKRAVGEAPGRFTLLVDGNSIEYTFGTHGVAWHWEKGPKVKLKKGPFELALHDLTGFDGRCDAIVFTKNKDIVLPNTNPEMKQWRCEHLGISTEPRLAGQYDLVISGAGVAGIAAALSAARNGLKVALINDRPVVGGNASSEVCVNIHGDLGFKPYPHVGDIVKEIQPAGEHYWHKGPFEVGESEDVKRLKLLQNEKNLDIYLSHRVNGVEMKEYSIKAVLATNVKTGESIRFEGRFFADCTGDGAVGYLAGADYEIVENGHMGRTNLWFVHDVKRPTVFPRCTWALNLYDFKLPKASLKVDGWFWESGFGHNPITKGEYIRDWNLRAAYGAWDAYKNDQGGFDTHEIKWLSYIAGMRESRRLLGDIILNRTNIEDSVAFVDGCVPLTWSLDTHYPDRRFAKGFEGDEFIAYCNQPKYSAPYWMPYRCLYSRDISNLFMAGRCASATRKAMGAARIQRATGMMGEIVGKAASICVKRNTSPRAVYTHYLEDLKSLMSK